MDGITGLMNPGALRRGGHSMVTYGAPGSQRVEFFSDKRYLVKESNAAGTPKYADEIFIKILTPGEKDNFTDWVKFRTPEDKEAGRDTKGYCSRFPMEWEAFKRNSQVVEVGTPLEMWPHPQLTKARAAEFKGLNIHNVEQLASISDSALDKLGMGARKLREDAKTYLDTAKGMAPINELKSENEELRQKLEALEGMINSQQEASDDSPKRRGRPPKSEG